MGFYDSWLFPRVLDLVMQQQQLIPFRQRIGEAASGRVLDVGIAVYGLPPVGDIGKSPLGCCAPCLRSAT